jgi:hypothetical protein
MHGRAGRVQAGLQVDGLQDHAWKRVRPAVEHLGAAPGAVREEERGRTGQAGAGCCSRR